MALNLQRCLVNIDSLAFVGEQSPNKLPCSCNGLVWLSLQLSPELRGK